MSAEVILTGTGVPHPMPGRAGAAALVRHRPGGHALEQDLTIQPADDDLFAQDLRDGGYTGAITVGADLVSVAVGAPGADT